MFTEENWNHVQYKNDDKKAIISLLSTPSDSAEGHELYYCITLLDEENNELFQSRFSSLETACQQMNAKYGDVWDFMDLSIESDGGGCGSCSAH